MPKNATARARKRERRRAHAKGSYLGNVASIKGFRKTDPPKHGAALKAKQQAVSAGDLVRQHSGVPVTAEDFGPLDTSVKAWEDLAPVKTIETFDGETKTVELTGSDKIKSSAAVKTMREMTEEEHEDIRERAAKKKKSFKKLAQQEGWEFIDPNGTRMRDADNWQRPA